MVDVRGMLLGERAVVSLLGLGVAVVVFYAGAAVTPYGQRTALLVLAALGLAAVHAAVNRGVVVCWVCVYLGVFAAVGYARWVDPVSVLVLAVTHPFLYSDPGGFTLLCGSLAYGIGRWPRHARSRWRAYRTPSTGGDDAESALQSRPSYWYSGALAVAVVPALGFVGRGPFRVAGAVLLPSPAWLGVYGVSLVAFAGLAVRAASRREGVLSSFLVWLCPFVALFARTEFVYFGGFGAVDPETLTSLDSLTVLGPVYTTLSAAVPPAVVLAVVSSAIGWSVRALLDDRTVAERGDQAVDSLDSRVQRVFDRFEDDDFPQPRVVVVVAVVLVSVLHPPVAVAGAESGPVSPDGTEISMHKGLCLGRCPVYTVTVCGEGIVYYEGDQFVDTNGTWRFEISQWQSASLLRAVFLADFFSVNYEPGPVVDAPPTSISVDTGPLERTVLYTWPRSAPPRLRLLERRLSSLVARFVDSAADRGIDPDRATNVTGTSPTCPSS